MRHYDEILDLIGSFGKYQKILVFGYGIPSCFYAPIVLHVLIFVGLEPLHQCKLPESITSSSIYQRNASAVTSLLIPTETKYGKSQPASCELYDLSAQNWTLFESNWTDAAAYNTKVACKFGWIYDTDEWIINLIVKWNLVCDRRIYLTIMSMCHYAGEAVGCLIFGTLMDRVGRRPVVLAMHAWFFIFGIVLLFSTTWQLFGFLAFIRALAVRSAWILPWIYVQEFVGEEHRSFVCMLLVIAFACGSGVLAALCYIATNGKTVISLASAPALVALLYIPLLQESPRWLLANGRTDQARKVITSMATVNDANITFAGIDDAMEQIIDSNQKDHQHVHKPNIWSPFVHGNNLKIKLCICCFLFAVPIVIYLGLNHHIRIYGSNPYFVFGVSALVEIPAGLIIPLTDRFGRARVGALAFLLAGILTLSGALAPLDTTWSIVLLALLIKFSITLCFNTVQLIATELFPTAVRGTSIGFVGFVGVLGAIAVPYIMHSETDAMRSPMVIFACLSFVSAAIILFLPETAGLTLLDSFIKEKTRPVGLKSLKRNLRGPDSVDEPINDID